MAGDNCEILKRLDQIEKQNEAIIRLVWGQNEQQQTPKVGTDFGINSEQKNALTEAERCDYFLLLKRNEKISQRKLIRQWLTKESKRVTNSEVDRMRKAVKRLTEKSKSDRNSGTDFGTRKPDES